MTESHPHRPSAGAARPPLRAWRGPTALLLAGVASLSGCYTHAPLSGAPRPGATLVVDLNDRGRTVLGDSIGPSAEQVRGLVQSGSDSSYVLRVASVRYLNGQSNQWSGEPLTIRADLVGRARERQFSRKRTWAVGLGAAAAILTFALSTDLLGSGAPRRTTEPPTGPVQ